ncbi:complement component 1 Q subcomponent-binding protein, mitochondrial [Takifugu rubripes]|uniref:Complement component 1 Q subcomponent-binding protein, mitochondrial n=1 Tax=Takifugu rubripes TaxID=31033 RepID=A0A674PBX6_TAKRU|nr:complement component 1 Q subcomponent-binding protein, mitochondrial [Takifugu rubripes]|eukprot:XP_003977011.1 PREDICTED: complement component 1 Q subcomponent-binding protein, mitochondrial [Takifugu rubripes]
MLKHIVRAAGAAVRVSSATSSATTRTLPFSCAALCSPCSVTTQPITRALWMLSNNGTSTGYRPKLFSSKVIYPSVSCGCGALHTEGDKAFGDFLSDEIKEEEKLQKNKSLPKMSGGWDLEMNGTEAKLTRNMSGEKITVTFNVNNSIPPNFEDEVEQGGQQKLEEKSEIVSAPNFVVEVTKQTSKHSLVFDCHFSEDEISHGEGEEQSEIFAIREVSFQPEGDLDWKETSYTLNTDSLDWALYDHLMDFLADRGVDNTFADELMELSTAVEHQEYIKFLEELQGFVKCN